MPLIGIILAVFAVTFFQRPWLTGGWLWDSANAAGFLALALILYLFVDQGTGVRQRAHRYIGYAAGLVVTLHVLLIWLPDPTIWSYATWSAPAPMWAAWGALAVVVAVVFLALPRLRRFWHDRYARFRQWHWTLSLLLIVLSLWHVIGSGFYVQTWEAVVLCLLAAILVGLTTQRRDIVKGTIPLSALAVAGLIPIVFVLVKGA